MEDLNRTTDSLTQSRRVSIGSIWANVLRFRIWEEAAQDIVDSAADVRVYFTRRSLQLREYDIVVYKKP